MDNNNQLTQNQMASMSSGQNQNFSGGLLTPTQLASLKSGDNPSNPTGSVGTDWDAFDKETGGVTNPGYKASTIDQKPAVGSNGSVVGGITGDYLSRLMDTYGQTPSKIGNDIKTGGDEITKDAQDTSFSAPFKVASDALKAGFRTAGDAANAIFAPISTAVGMAFDKLGITDAASHNSIVDELSNNKWLQDFAVAHPNAGDDFGRALTLALSGGETEEIDPKSVANEVKGYLSGVKDTATNAAGNTIEAVKTVPSTVKNTVKQGFVPNITPEEATGKIIQGAPEDVTPSLNAIKTLGDTSSIKTYQDLNDATNAKISELSKAQDAELGKDTTQYKIQQLATKVGTQEAAHNYVIDAIKQLKDYYTKTNDVANLQKINNYETKIDPIKGSGLTLKNINDIARMHGSDLNGYNANGELASGLTKQAAENTRQGLKSTIRNLLPDDTSKNLDAQISDLYTLKDLSKNMADKVNSINQKTVKQGIIPKTVGKVVGKAIKTVDTFTGHPLKIIGKAMGNPGNAETMNAIDLETNLSKYLKSIRSSGKTKSGINYTIKE